MLCTTQLERLWPLLTRFWRDRMALDRGLMLAMLALRARIAYVIDNITYYMQVGTSHRTCRIPCQ